MNIIKSVLLPSKYYTIGELGDTNFRAIGSIVDIPETVLVHLDSGANLYRFDYYNVCITYYNSIN